MADSTRKPTVNKSNYDQRLLGNLDFGIVLAEILARGNQVRFQARGRSMIPFIQDGDILSIAPANQAVPAIGKVVAYNQPETGYLIVHRVVGRKDGRFLIKGDNSNQRGEYWIPSSAIFGCVIAIDRDRKRVRFGLGLERVFIALLSRLSLLNRITRRLSGVFKK